MKRLQRILAPVDMTEPSRSGLKLAMALAVENGADLLALHVANEFQAWQMLDETGFPSDRIYRWEVDRVVREALLDLNRYLEPAMTDIRHLPAFRRRVVLGDAALRIVEMARDEESDLIVLSPRPHSALRRLFCGSVTDKVTRFAPCPVLSISQTERSQRRQGKSVPVVGGLLQALQVS
ncbi:MAG TPA: universal stress protein [Candidatus Binatia bacterium]|jgi:universal stress protein A